MKICAVIAEFNPFHNGHKYLMDEIRKLGFTHIVVIMSGNFVQRGEPAIISKRLRVKAALLNGADAVLEMPVVWTLTSAEKYALAGVEIAGGLGCVDALAFGSECGDINCLRKTAKILESDKFFYFLKKNLSTGVTFAKAREMAVNSVSENKNLSEYLRDPNNILGVEYIKGINKLGLDIEPITVKRLCRDTMHTYRSASEIRQMIKASDNEFKKYIPKSSCEAISKELSKGNIVHCLEYTNQSIMYNLRTTSINDIIKLSDISEGLENRIIKAAKKSICLNDFLCSVKTKRYTMSRIKRILMCNFLGINKDIQDTSVPYIRVLGVNEKGHEILKIAKKTASLPIVCNYSGVKKLSEKSKEVFKTECRASDLYSLFSSEIKSCGCEESFKIITS